MLLVLIALSLIPFRSWFAMLLFGVIHIHFIPEIPAFGFWPTFFLVWLIQVVITKADFSSTTATD